MRAVSGVVLGVLLVGPLCPTRASASEISGEYLEMRTCDVYTGPCFANAEVGLAGQEAVLAWSIDKGEHKGVDLSGLRVVMAVRASDTLGLGSGLNVNPYPIHAVVYVDEKASVEQREALVAFAKASAIRASGEVVRVDTVPIKIAVDHDGMVGIVKAGKAVEMKTRMLCEDDHICTNEVCYYPPLAEVDHFMPAVTETGRYKGRGLGTQWSIPNTRSAYIATFSYSH